MAEEPEEDVEQTLVAKPRGNDGRELERPLTRGDSLGRYVVLDLLGVGAMGAVYAAYDPQLDRRIALKVLRHGSEAREHGQGRLVREAQAMAQLAHPNVIQVFDVGTVDDDVYVAMEYVEGRGLGSWLKEEPRRVEAIVEAFGQAARGLHHAHESGVVHRDFKPDNCLVDGADRVRVIDFGIARHRPSDEVTAPLDGEELARAVEGSPSALAKTVETNVGMLIGTPAYMSPEQFEGRPAEARSDQFAFCIALYEAIYGERPFGGGNVLQLMNAVTSVELEPPPKRNDVPEHVRAAILKGLSKAPEARFGTMAELADALAPAEVAAAGIGPWILGGLFVVAVAALFVASRGVGGEACQDLDEHLRGVWDEERQDRLSSHFEATNTAIGDESFERVRHRLDDYAAAWVGEREEACRATHERHEQTEEVLELRMGCLDRQLARLRASVDVLAATDSAGVSHAIQVVSDLDHPDRCADVERLRAQAANEPPPELEARVAQVRAQLVRARALHESGEYGRALQEVVAAHDDAHGIDYAPLSAEILLIRSRIHVSTGDLEGAKRELFEAARLADRGGDARTEAAAWIDLVFVVGSKMRDRDQSMLWLAFAQDALAQTDGDPLLSGRLRYYEGLLHAATGHADRALQAYEDAERHYRDFLPEGHWRFAVVEAARASALRHLGRHEESLAAYQEALDGLRSALGERHPNVALVLSNLAIVLREADRLEEARTAYERALELKRQTLGPDHPSVAFTLVNLAHLERRLGRYDRAETLLAEALELRRRAVGSSHPLFASVIGHQAEVALDRGDETEGSRLYQEALGMAEGHGDAWSTALARNNLAWARVRGGDYAQAEELSRTALAAFLEREVDDLHTAFPRTILGLAFVQQARPEEAVGPLTAALEARSHGGVQPEHLGLTQLALGRALYESGRDPLRGYQLVEGSVTQFEAAHACGNWGRAQAHEWLAAHERPPAELRVQ